MKFYKVSSVYLDYLRFDFPNIMEQAKPNSNEKFILGVIIEIGNNKYYAPVSSLNQQKKEKTHLLHVDENGQIDKTQLIKRMRKRLFPIRDSSRNNEITSFLRLDYMYPVHDNDLIDFDITRLQDDNYKSLVEKEDSYCKHNKDEIKVFAARVYKNSKNPKDPLYGKCFDFAILEQIYNKWVENNNY